MSSNRAKRLDCGGFSTAFAILKSGSLIAEFSRLAGKTVAHPVIFFEPNARRQRL
jgi:hypothetical protein